MMIDIMGAPTKTLREEIGDENYRNLQGRVAARKQAREEMYQLERANVKHRAYENSQGICIEITRPGFGKTTSVSTRIIPWP